MGPGAQTGDRGYRNGEREGGVSRGFNRDISRVWGERAPQVVNAISTSANRFGVPADLLAGLLKQESGFNPNARSPAGAMGIAQFMPGTARGEGLQNPLNAFEAIPASAKHLRGLYDYATARLGARGDDAWLLTLAGYNAGMGNVEKAVRRARSTEWRAVSRFLPAETRNYIPAILGHMRQAGGR